jgi:hypothetical protein
MGKLHSAVNYVSITSKSNEIQCRDVKGIKKGMKNFTHLLKDGRACVCASACVSVLEKYF